MSPPPPHSGAISTPSQRRRVTRACDQCSRTRTKCDGSSPCARCLSLEITCEYLRARKRRGKIGRTKLAQRAIKEAAEEARRRDPGQESSSKCSAGEQPMTAKSETWRPVAHLTCGNAASSAISPERDRAMGNLESANSSIVETTKDLSPSSKANTQIKQHSGISGVVEPNHLRGQSPELVSCQHRQCTDASLLSGCVGSKQYCKYLPNIQGEPQDAMRSSAEATTNTSDDGTSCATASDSICASAKDIPEGHDNLLTLHGFEAGTQGRVVHDLEINTDFLCQLLPGWSLNKRTQT